MKKKLLKIHPTTLILPYVINLLRKNYLFWIFLLLGLIILTNQIHEAYPDEFENILGGRYLLSLRFPYSGFFTHHNPGAFFLSAVVYLVSGASFVRFRILLGIFFLISYIAFYFFIKKRFGAVESKLLIFFYIFITFGATFDWGHMLLADSLSAYLLIPSYIICLLLALRHKALTKTDLWVISILTFSSILTTLTQSYASLVIYFFVFIWNLKHKSIPWKNFSLIILSPFLFFLIYLLITGSILEYYRQAIDFNISYYIHLPDGVSSKNPLRIGIVFLVKFFENFKSALLQVKDFNLGSPFTHSLALSNTALIAYLILKRRFYLIAFVWVFLSFINSRGDPYKTSETDYQAIAYHFGSIFNGLLAMFLLWKEAQQNEYATKKFLVNALILLLGIYQVALFFLFFDKWLDKTYKKYMGTLPLIYDRPSIANVINDLLAKNEYYYIAPFDFENQIYIKSKPASKYIVILPGMDQSPRIQNEILIEVKKNRPKIIVFNTELSVYQAYPGRFFVDYLKQEYANLAQLGVPCEGYQSKQKWYGDYDFERHLFLDKNQKDAVWKLLIEKGYLYPISQQEADKIPLCIELKKH